MFRVFGSSHSLIDIVEFESRMLMNLNREKSKSNLSRNSFRFQRTLTMFYRQMKCEKALVHYSLCHVVPRFDRDHGKSSGFDFVETFVLRREMSEILFS